MSNAFILSSTDAAVSDGIDKTHRLLVLVHPSPPHSTIGQRLEFQDQIGRCGGRAAAIQDGGAVQLVDNDVEVSIRTKAECIDPRQSGVIDQDSILTVGIDNTNSVAKMAIMNRFIVGERLSIESLTSGVEGHNYSSAA